MLTVTAAQAGNPAAGVFGLIGLSVLVSIPVILYFVPTFVALRRHVPNLGSVIVVNVLLGWSVIGWVVALAMAARSTQPRVVRLEDPRQGYPPAA